MRTLLCTEIHLLKAVACSFYEKKNKLLVKYLCDFLNKKSRKWKFINFRNFLKHENEIFFKHNHHTNRFYKILRRKKYFFFLQFGRGLQTNQYHFKLFKCRYQHPKISSTRSRGLLFKFKKSQIYKLKSLLFFKC